MKFWKKCSRKIWILGVALGVLFLALGNEQLEDIYRKAVMICLECIGIG